MLELQKYSFDVFYRPGVQHTNADALSRLPAMSDTEWEVYKKGYMIRCAEQQSTSAAVLFTIPAVNLTTVQGVLHSADRVSSLATLEGGVGEQQSETPVLSEQEATELTLTQLEGQADLHIQQIRDAIRTDGEFGSCVKVLEWDTEWIKTLTQSEFKRVKRMATMFELLDGVLYRVLDRGLEGRRRVVIPATMVLPMIRECHASYWGVAHSKGEKLYEMMARHLWFPSMFKKVTEVCKTCPECLLCEDPKGGGSFTPAETIPTPRHAWQMFSMDFVGPIDTVIDLTETERVQTGVTQENAWGAEVTPGHLLVVTDLLTRYV